LRTFKKLLLELCLRDLNLHCLVNLLCVAAFVIGIVLDRRGEKRIDECGLP